MSEEEIRGIDVEVQPPRGQEAAILARLRSEGLVGRVGGRLWPAAWVAAGLAAGLAAGWLITRPAPAADPAGPRYVLMLEHGPTEGGGDEATRVKAVIAWAREQRRAGRSLDGEKLTDDALVVSAAGVAPAPAERWMLGGYFVVQARDDEDATRLASSHPIVGWGGRVVVRKIDDLR